MLDAPLIDADTLADIQRSFAAALPRIEGLAGAHHRHLRGDRKEEAVAETVALAWAAYRTLALRGRDVVRLLGKIVDFSARRVRCGRGLTNINPSRDVLSATARFRHRYRVNSLPLSETEDTAAEILDALRDDTSPADRAILNVDFAVWLDTLDSKRRAVAVQLASGLNTVDVSRLHGVTRARISQLRIELLGEWERRHGDG